MSATQRFLAVHVEIVDEYGSTYVRDYVRGAKRISEADFASFALGDLIRMVMSETDRGPASYTVVEIPEEKVA
jgi:hypothetical protein